MDCQSGPRDRIVTPGGPAQRPEGWWSAFDRLFGNKPPAKRSPGINGPCCGPARSTTLPGDARQAMGPCT